MVSVDVKHYVYLLTIIKTELLFFYPWRTRLLCTCVLGRYVASTVVLGSEGADSVGGQLRGYKERPVSGVNHRVPGEIKRSRDLRGGRWSWTLTFAQKRS